jgi:hypothetical protein
VRRDRMKRSRGLINRENGVKDARMVKKREGVGGGLCV